MIRPSDMHIDPALQSEADEAQVRACRRYLQQQEAAYMIALANKAWLRRRRRWLLWIRIGIAADILLLVLSLIYGPGMGADIMLAGWLVGLGWMHERVWREIESGCGR